jgi:hypothetical protein
MVMLPVKNEVGDVGTEPLFGRFKFTPTGTIIELPGTGARPVSEHVAAAQLTVVSVAGLPSGSVIVQVCAIEFTEIMKMKKVVAIRKVTILIPIKF